MTARVSVTDSQNGHGRAARLAKALADPPSSAVLLTLHFDTTPQPMPLGEWTKDQWVDPGLVQQIDDIITDNHRELGLADSKYALSFWTEPDASGVARQCRVRTFTERTKKDIMAQGSGGNLVPLLDGTARDAGVLAQNATLHLFKALMEGLEDNRRDSRAQNSLLVQQVTRLSAELALSQSQLREVHDAYMELREQMAETPKEDLPPAVRAFMELMMSKAPEILKAMGVKLGGAG